VRAAGPRREHARGRRPNGLLSQGTLNQENKPEKAAQLHSLFHGMFCADRWGKIQVSILGFYAYSEKDN